MWFFKYLQSLSYWTYSCFKTFVTFVKSTILESIPLEFFFSNEGGITWIPFLLFSILLVTLTIFIITPVFIIFFCFYSINFVFFLLISLNVDSYKLFLVYYGFDIGPRSFIVYCLAFFSGWYPTLRYFIERFKGHKYIWNKDYSTIDKNSQFFKDIIAVGHYKIFYFIFHFFGFVMCSLYIYFLFPEDLSRTYIEILFVLVFYLIICFVHFHSILVYLYSIDIQKDGEKRLNLGLINKKEYSDLSSNVEFYMYFRLFYQTCSICVHFIVWSQIVSACYNPSFLFIYYHFCIVFILFCFSLTILYIFLLMYNNRNDFFFLLYLLFLYIIVGVLWYIACVYFYTDLIVIKESYVILFYPESILDFLDYTLCPDYSDFFYYPSIYSVDTL